MHSGRGCVPGNAQGRSTRLPAAAAAAPTPPPSPARRSTPWQRAAHSARRRTAEGPTQVRKCRTRPLPAPSLCLRVIARPHSAGLKDDSEVPLAPPHAKARRLLSEAPSGPRFTASRVDSVRLCGRQAQGGAACALVCASRAASRASGPSQLTAATARLTWPGAAPPSKGRGCLLLQRFCSQCVPVLGVGISCPQLTRPVRAAYRDWRLLLEQH